MVFKEEAGICQVGFQAPNIQALFNGNIAETKLSEVKPYIVGSDEMSDFTLHKVGSFSDSLVEDFYEVAEEIEKYAWEVE